MTSPLPVSAQPWGFEMAKDPAANAFIKSLKAGMKHIDDVRDNYYQRFAVRGEVPTKKDVQDYQKFLMEAKQVSAVMWADIHECEKAISGFGGSGDTWFSAGKQALAMMQKKAH
jgi:hypothetical protein